MLHALTSASRTITHTPSLVAVVERCLERFISQIPSLAFKDWVQLSHSLVVPELGVEEYISQCDQDGAALTLFASSVKGCSSLEDVYSKKSIVLDRFVAWIKQQAENFSASNEEKLLFLVVQIIALASPAADRACVLKVTKLLSEMGEDPHKVTLLRVIGLSSNMANASVRFRVAARLISISLQIHLQQNPSDVESALPEASPAQIQISLESLSVLASAKVYQEVSQDLVWAHQKVSHTPHQEFVDAVLVRMFPAAQWIRGVCVPLAPSGGAIHMPCDLK
jgi:hypothetical protein